MKRLAERVLLILLMITMLAGTLPVTTMADGVRESLFYQMEKGLSASEKETDDAGDEHAEKHAVELTIDKPFSGMAEDYNREFSFTLTGLEQGAIGKFTKHEWFENYQKYFAMAGPEGSGTWTAEVIPAGSSNYGIRFTLRHNQRIELEGLPADTVLTLTEENGFYTATVEEVIPEGESSKLMLLTSARGQGPEAATTIGEAGHTAVIFQMLADAELQVTKKMETISPTGVRLRWTPYLMMLIFGGILLTVTGKRKKKEHDR